MSSYFIYTITADDGKEYVFDTNIHGCANVAKALKINTKRVRRGGNLLGESLTVGANLEMQKSDEMEQNVQAPT